MLIAAIVLLAEPTAVAASRNSDNSTEENIFHLAKSSARVELTLIGRAGRFDETGAFSFGVELDLLAGRSVRLGGALIRALPFDEDVPKELNYGGLIVGVSSDDRELVQFEGLVLAGGGSAHLAGIGYPVFVLEPELAASIGVLGAGDVFRLKLRAGVGHRWVVADGLPVFGGPFDGLFGELSIRLAFGKGE